MVKREKEEKEICAGKKMLAQEAAKYHSLYIKMDAILAARKRASFLIT